MSRMVSTRVEQARTRARRSWKRHGPELLYTYTFRAPEQDEPEWSAYHLEAATQDLLDRFRASYPKDLNRRKYGILQSRIDSPTDPCWFIVGDDGELCGYCHLSWSDTVNERIHHRVAVAPHQAYFFDSYVVKKHRGKRIHAASIAHRLHLAREHGVTEGLTTISRGNGRSVASFRWFGLTRVERLVYLPDLKRTVSLPLRRRRAG
jgi:GNAT superfamily N-acetyltransferase